jgi:hypothetical protein
MCRKLKFLLFICAGLGVLGCNEVRQQRTKVPIVEEFNVPPDEERYNQPPEAAYRKPTIKKDVNIRQAIGPGGPSSAGGGGGFGGPGGGGSSFGGPQR